MRPISFPYSLSHLKNITNQRLESNHLANQNMVFKWVLRQAVGKKVLENKRFEKEKNGQAPVRTV